MQRGRAARAKVEALKAEKAALQAEAAAAAVESEEAAAEAAEATAEVAAETSCREFFDSYAEEEANASAASCRRRVLTAKGLARALAEAGSPVSEKTLTKRMVGLMVELRKSQQPATIPKVYKGCASWTHIIRLTLSVLKAACVSNP